MLGTASAQIILLFVTSILTRLYSPEAFGTLALLVTSVTLLSIVATGRYESAVTLPEQDAEATLLVVLALFIMLATVLVLTAVVYFSGDSLLAALGLSP